MESEGVGTPQDLVGQTLGGKYRIRGVLGEGGMGVVLEAENVVIRRPVAIKLLHANLVGDKTTVERFHIEARAAAATGHEHIVEVLDLGSTEKGIPYIVMELLDGINLQQLLKREAVLDLGRTCRIAAQVLSALGAVHARGIVHRDLKPANIILTRRAGRDDFVKLVDFGISKFREARAGQGHLTATGVVLGTPHYMAPEQARGEAALDHRVDLYAVGAIMYRCLSGRVPYRGANYNQILARILAGSPPPVREVRPSLAPEVSDVVEKAMAHSSTRRFQSAVTFARALSDLGLVEIAVQPPVDGRTPPSGAMRREPSARLRAAGPASEPAAGMSPVGLEATVDMSDPGAMRPVGRSSESQAGREAGESMSVTLPVTERPRWQSSEQAAVEDKDAGAAFGRDRGLAGRSAEAGGAAKSARTGDTGPSARPGRGPDPAATPPSGRTPHSGATPPSAETLREAGGQASVERGLPEIEAAGARRRLLRYLPILSLVLVGGIGGALFVAYMGRRRTERKPAAEKKKPAVPKKRPYRLSFAQYMPRESAREAMQDIAGYLRSALNRPIQVVVADEFDRVGSGLAAGDLDLAMLSPLLYVEAKRRYPGLRLLSSLVSKGSTTYQGLILARVDRNIHTLQELKGKTFCWVSRFSTSGYLFPMALFLSRNLDPEKLFARAYYTGYHDEALRRLEAGVCDAAAVFSSTYFHAKVQGVIKTGIHVVAATEPIPRDAICAGRKMTEKDIAEVTRALLAFSPAKHTSGRPLAGVFQISSFVTVKDSFYDPVRRVMDALEAYRRGENPWKEKKKKKTRP